MATKIVSEPILEAQPHDTFDSILVLDFGSQTSHLITRRLRESHVYSEMLPCTQKLADLSWTPKGIILSGGPASVYAEGAPHVDPAVFESGIPILGICYGLQELSWHFSKNVIAGERREYGHADVKIESREGWDNRLLQGIDGKSIEVYMSHGDKLKDLPEDFITIASTANAPFAGITHVTKPYFGIQFHPEVTHTPKGGKILENFATVISGCKADWTMDQFTPQEVARIRKLVGDKGRVIGAVSGGVDSTVAAKLMDTAIGKRFHAVLVDNGLLRKNEAKEVHANLTKTLGINLTVVDASERFLAALAGVSDPEKKRKIIGGLFIDIFQETALKLDKEESELGPIEWLLQGTLYPDVIESISFRGPSETIKTHHNVGGLPSTMKLKLIEPLRELFKDEVRELGTKLGITPEMVWRHPFPGPGLAIRIPCQEVTAGKIKIVQEVDAIFIEEIRKEGIYKEISQAIAALVAGNYVGVKGDRRVYEGMISFRAVVTTDFMTATPYHFKPDFVDRVTSRVINEVDGVTRVVWECKLFPLCRIIHC
jgi:GMP synthase (glutamine-hydrolysing)